MTKVHLDTDIGGDIDDLCALALLLAWPDVDLLAVTTNSDDGGRRAGYARAALDLAGCRSVAVAAGADVALDCYRVRPGLPDEASYWPEPIRPVATPVEAALDRLEESIEAGATVIAIGAFTNLALLERRSPGLLRRANLYLMGGYVFPPRSGFPPWDHTSDWNIQVDAASAHAVLQHANPTLIPLSVTAETYLRRAHLPRLARGGPLARLIARQAEVFAREEGIEARWGQTCAGLPDDTINFQHDPLACAIALGWRDGVELSEIPLRSEIEDGWLRQRVETGGVPTRIVTGLDGARFSEFWLEAVTAV